MTLSHPSIVVTFPQLFNKLTIPQKASKVKWRKATEIKVAAEVPAIDGWKRVIPIKEKGRVQTYDLQIANTHNFVGNDIVAHNTYISGNTGIGTLSNNIKLHLTGNGTGTGVNLLTQNSTQTNFGLSVLDNGNVGIGTTGPGVLLDIISSATTPELRFKNSGSSTVNLILDAASTKESVISFRENGSNRWQVFSDNDIANDPL